jgi:tetratricopeptide (TPR) repeat protein
VLDQPRIGAPAGRRLEEAAAAHHHALEHAGRVGDVEKTAVVRLDLAVVHLNQGRWFEAKEGFEAAVPRFRQMGHPLGVAASLYNLADTLRWMGRLDEARAALDQAEESLGQVDMPYLQVHVMVARAELLLARGSFAEAAGLSERALALAENSGYPSGIHLGRLSLGRVLRASGSAAAAEQEFRTALEGFERSGERLEAARARAELAAVLGRDEEAEMLVREAREMIEHLGASPWLEHLPQPDHDPVPA